MAAEKLPELHQAMEAEARDRLAPLLPGGQDNVRDRDPDGGRRR